MSFYAWFSLITTILNANYVRLPVDKQQHMRNSTVQPQNFAKYTMSLSPNFLRFYYIHNVEVKHVFKHLKYFTF